MPTSGTLGVSTNSADISLALVDGTPFKLNVSHGSGSVKNDLTTTDSASFALVLSVSSGDIHISKN